MKGFRCTVVLALTMMLTFWGCVSSDEPPVLGDKWVTLQGTVRDYLTNAPIPGATVTLLAGTPRTASTDGNGYWSMSSVACETGVDLQIRFAAAGHAAFVGDLAVVNDLVQTCNVTLSSFIDVTGHVYASNEPADGATVLLSYNYNAGMLPYDDLGHTDPPVEVVRIEATTAADGSFTLQNVAADVVGQLIVLAFDADGDLVAEYDTYVLPGGITASEYANNNTEINIDLEGAGAAVDVVYSNISDHAIVTADENLMAILNLPVDPSRIVVDLWFHQGDTVVNGAPAGPQVWVPVALAWTLGNTQITVDPLQDLTGDGTYMLTLGQEFVGVPAGTNGANFAGWSSEFVLPSELIPTIASPTAVAVDVSYYDYVVDWENILVYDIALTPDDADYEIYSGLNVPLQWDPVAGAASYKIYAQWPGAATWVEVGEVDNPIIIDGLVEGKADLSSAGASVFDVYPDASYTTPYGVAVGGNDPFAEGYSIVLVVTALDARDQESDVTTAPTVTLADNKAPSLLREAGIDLNPVTGNDVVYDLAGPDITLVLSEPIEEDPSGAVAVTSSNALVAVTSERLGYAGTPLEGDFCLSVEASLTGMTTALTEDYVINGRFDVTIGDADQFWLGQLVSVTDATGFEVATATVQQIDTANNYLLVTVASGNLNSCLVGHTVTGLGDVRQRIERMSIVGWATGTSNNRLDTNVVGPVANMAINDVLSITYRSAAGGSSTVESRTVTAFEISVGNTTVLVLDNALTVTGTETYNLLDRDGDKIDVSGIQDRAGNAVDATADTVQIMGGNYIVTGN